ncbi:olfactory receptor 1019-like [Tachyglossus aculeatus]|uniref:olfactory receptor 1019-like n=1 Tax=Tachyglossus aculeatus TaxID=9261 RepID=UPI0018F49D15|nr:olfactory receptor 1019-like [Tachyglossus aculeatus]
MRPGGEMFGGNHTSVAEFILMGLTDNTWMKIACFMTFLGMYLVTLVGNLGMILLIWVDPRLRSPMYFFISHLSLVDLGYSSAVTPHMLSDFVGKGKSISFSSCATQMYFFVIFASTECYLLAAMAYDRYVAICNPLLYAVTMSPKICAQLVIGCYLVGFVTATTQTILTFRLSFCASNVINHFFCDLPPLLELSCSDTHVNETVLLLFAIFLGVFTSVEILLSYIYILATILRIGSAEGRHKAFSTCTSHLAAVTIFYGTTVFMYVRPSSSYSLDSDKVTSVFYTAVIPMLNPMIYSLRNKEVKNAMNRFIYQGRGP